MAGSQASNNEREFSDPNQDNRTSGPTSPNLTDPFTGRDDQFIWSAFKQNDEQAFIVIYQRHFHELINYGHQFTHDVQFLEDCIQDLFIDLKKNRNNLTGFNSSIKFYLYKALKRRIIEYKRKAAGISLDQIMNADQFEVVLPAEAVLIENQIREEQINRLAKAMTNLTVRQREALFYFYHENLSYQQIRELMGMDHVRSVRNLVYKAIAVLKSSFKLLLSF